MLWKLAADLDGKLTSVEILETEPFIICHEPMKTDDEFLAKSFQNLCRFYSLHNDEIYKVESDLQKTNREVQLMLNDPEFLLTDKHNIAPMEVYSYTRRMKSNGKKIRLAFATINFIRNKFEEIRRGLTRYSNWVKNPDHLRRFEEVGLAANSKQLSKPAKIVYKFTKEDKISNFDDHVDLVSDDYKAEKEAILILSELTAESKVSSKTTPIPTTQLYNKKEGGRLPTQGTTQSQMRKETEASQTLSEPKEYIVSDRDVKPQQYVVRDLDYEREEPITQPIISEKRAIDGFKYNNKNYKRAIAKHLIPTEEIERISENREEDLQTNRLPSVSQINEPIRISRVQSIPQNVQSFSTIQNQQINPEMKISDETENLRKEIELLRRENRTLQNKLSQSEMSEIPQEREELTRTIKIKDVDNYANNIEHDERVIATERDLETLENQNLNKVGKIYQKSLNDEDKENIKPIKNFKNVRISEKSSLEKENIKPSLLPVFIRHHVGLKNWALNIRKSIIIPEPSPIKCVECAQDLEYIILGLKNGKIVFLRFTNFASIIEENRINLSDQPVKSLLYLSDGRNLFCGTKDGKLLRIDLQNFTKKILCELNNSIVGITNLMNGRSICLASGKSIYEFDIISNKIIYSIPAHDSDITDIIYNQHKDILCTSSKDKSVKIWNYSNKECLGILQGHQDIIKSICLAETTKYNVLCSVSKDSYITFWNLNDKNLTKSLKCKSSAKKIFNLWDKKSVVTVHKSGEFNLWNLENDDVKEFIFNKTPYSSGVFFDDGHNLIMTTESGTVEFWNAK